MKTILLWLLIIVLQFNHLLTAATQHRSQIRVRDPFVLPDPATKTYFIYNSTTPAIDSNDPHKAVVVYRSKDLENWETPITVFEVPENHWGRETVWAPEVHRYQGKYYLFITLTSNDALPTPAGRPQNLKRGTEILVADGPEGPFKPLAKQAQTPADWMALDGTLWIEEGIPYMIFCHEWIQITDGSMDLVRLKDDLSAPVGDPVKLFHASEADWVRCRGDLGELFQGKRYHAYIT
jgi:arabinan endo-1,5-alpha-L-arabinosidase